MTTYLLLRLVGCLRRIARAQERLADCAEQAQTPRRTAPPKLTQLDVASYKGWQEREDRVRSGEEPR